MGWLRKIYEEGKINASRSGITLPSFDDFWTAGKTVDISSQLPPSSEPLARFRSDPLGSPLPTPSGRIEIYSSVVSSFGYPDCPGMPVWIEKSERLGSERSTRYPLHLLSPQPANKLHSQLDFARTSQGDKLHGRERLFINPADADERGISDGSIVRVHNDRGVLLAAAIYCESLMRGVLHLPTGAWWDLQNELDVHGNPNTVCADVPTSSLAQGCTAQSCLVEVEPYQGKPQSVSIHELPTIAAS